MRSKKIRVLVALVALSLSTATSNEVYSTFSSYSVNSVEAASKTIKAIGAEKSTAEKIDEALMNGQSVTLKIKGDSKEGNRVLKGLRTWIKYVNGQGVIFQTTKESTGQDWQTYKISSNDAKLYKYSVKYVKKLFKNVQEGKASPWVWNSYLTLPGYESEVQFQKTLYDHYKASGTEYTTMGNYLMGELEKYNKAKNETYSDGEDPYFMFEDDENDDFSSETVDYISLTKSSLGSGLSQYEWLMYIPYETEDLSSTEACAYAYERIFDAEDFAHLSDALKIFAVSASGYFGCHSYSDQGFHMSYDSDKKNFDYSKPYENMKRLYKGTASGVCATFADYEILLWDQLGIKSFGNSSGRFNHAWSVVKVKNSAKKTMWIQYDYWMGDSCVVTGSDEEDYKVYMAGIKGAPKKKNWTLWDFN